MISHLLLFGSKSLLWRKRRLYETIFLQNTFLDHVDSARRHSISTCFRPSACTGGECSIPQLHHSKHDCKPKLSTCYTYLSPRIKMFLSLAGDWRSWSSLGLRLIQHLPPTCNGVELEQSKHLSVEIEKEFSKTYVPNLFPKIAKRGIFDQHPSVLYVHSLCITEPNIQSHP